MDFKGVTWAGNIYQKFEAMCLEVEEVMYQDTVKYVENQVQKVGVSVKKFYSEVMQDMTPPSPVKVAAGGDLSLNLYAHTDINKKPKSFLPDSPRELKKIKTGDESISDLIAEKLSSLSGQNDVNQFPPPCKNVPAESEPCPAKSNRLGVHRRPIGIRRISRLERPSKVSSPTISLSELGSGDIAKRDMGESCAEATGGKKVKSTSEFVERRDLEEVIENTMLDISNDCLVSDKITPSESVGRTKDEPEHVSSLGHNITTNSFDIEPNGELDAISDEGKSYQDWSSLNTSINTGDVAFQVEEATISDEDEFELENVSNLEFAESIIEISDTFEKSNLEETCVLVEGDDNLDFVLQGTKKPKSYKKKIREALSSKLRPTRKQGFTSSSVNKMALVESSRNSLESEWELL